MAGLVTGVHLQPSKLSSFGSSFPHPEESLPTSLGERGFSFPFAHLQLAQSLLFCCCFVLSFLFAVMEPQPGCAFVSREVRGEWGKAWAPHARYSVHWILADTTQILCSLPRCWMFRMTAVRQRHLGDEFPVLASTGASGNDKPNFPFCCWVGCVLFFVLVFTFSAVPLSLIATLHPTAWGQLCTSCWIRR